MSRTKRPPFWFCLLFLAAGLGALGWGVWDLVLAVGSTSWSTAQGRVTSSEMASKRGRKGGTTYYADVEYRYTVEGRTYSNDQIWFGQFGSSDSDTAREVLKQYPDGRKIAVYYDSDDPDCSVLQPGVFRSTWVLPGFGLLFTSAGTWLLFCWWKMRS